MFFYDFRFLTEAQIYGKIDKIIIYLYTMYTSVDRKLDFSSGTVTLLLRLDESVQNQASLWQQAIKWNLAYLSEEDVKKAQNIKSWYDFEKSFSYSSEKYRLKPDKALLLQKHREDHNYIFKNIVECLWENF